MAMVISYLFYKKIDEIQFDLIRITLKFKRILRLQIYNHNNKRNHQSSFDPNKLFLTQFFSCIKK